MSETQKIKLLNLGGAIIPLGTVICYFLLIFSFHKKSGTYDTFYFRQYVGIIIFGFLLSLLAKPFGTMFFGISNIVTLILVIINVVNIVKENKQELPIVGKYFEQHLKFI